MKRFVVEHFSSSKYINTPFSEYDILELQDTFLTNGLHRLKVPNLVIGRSVVSTFLESLNCYSKIACLTLSRAPLKPTICNLYDELLFSDAMSFKSDALETFLLEEFYYDFLWIEATRNLIEAPWFFHLENKLIEFNLITTMPIVLFSYESDN